MEEHPVVRGDLRGLVILPGSALRIAAAQVSWRQHCLNPEIKEHCLRGQPDLREEALRTAAREVEHGFRIHAGLARITDHRHHMAVLDVEQGARGLLRQVARHLLVHKVNHLRLQIRFARGGGRLAGAGAGKRAQQIHRQALCLVGPFNRDLAQQADAFR